MARAELLNNTSIPIDGGDSGVEQSARNLRIISREEYDAIRAILDGDVAPIDTLREAFANRKFVFKQTKTLW